MTVPKISLAECRKAVAALVGVVAMVVSSGVLTGQALTVCEAILAFATALGVYAVPNRAPAGPVVSPIVQTTVTGGKP